jgi:hypothetical protein
MGLLIYKGHRRHLKNHTCYVQDRIKTVLNEEFDKEKEK